MRLFIPYSIQILLLAAVCFSYSAFAQDTFQYTSSSGDTASKARLLQLATRKFESDKNALSGTYKKELEKEYTERFHYIRKIYEQQELILDQEAKGYLAQLSGIILQHNPELAALQPRILFSRNYVPNAASYGEGTILFHAGLFNRLNNESQVAFVLCHELAHYYLDHSNKRIGQYVHTVNSKEFQQKLKDIQKSEYLKNRSVNELAQAVSYKNRRHGRYNESEADSLALEFLRKTNFEVRESLTVLALLDSIDGHKHPGLSVKEVFNFPQYPFRDRWVKQSSRSLGEAMLQAGTGTSKDTATADSMKTHPDCRQRIEALAPRVNAFDTRERQLFLVNRAAFEKLVRRFDYDVIDYCFLNKETGRALFYALQLYKKDAHSPYLAAIIGKCMNELYTARLEHVMSKHADAPHPDMDPEYAEFLRFLQNLSLADMASINYYFLQRESPKHQTYPAFREAMEKASANFKTQSSTN
jgi:Peptidase family M48